MTHTYKYEMYEGHIIALDNGSRLLIDTGAPSTVADISPLTIAGRSFRTQSSYMGISMDSFRKDVGTPINVLVGTDILNQYDVLIDPESRSISFSEDELPLAGQSLEMGNFMSIPIIGATVGRDRVKMFFDTGAKLSYIHPRITNSFQSVGTEEDFYPGHGKFSTNVYDVPVVLGAERFVLRAGNLPTLMQMTLTMAQTSVILGTAVLRTHKVLYATRRSTMTLQRVG